MSPLKQPLITSEEVKDIAPIFPLYVKFPEEDFNLIRRAERFDDEGNMFFSELSAVFREKCVRKR